MGKHIKTEMEPLSFLIGRWHTEGEIRASSNHPAGETGPQSSLFSLLLCLLLGTIFLLLAKRKNNWIKPRWQTTAANKNIATTVV